MSLWRLAFQRLVFPVVHKGSTSPLLAAAPQLLPRVQNIPAQFQLTRNHTSFFVKLNADQLWKGCTSVSNAGRKRGRARSVARKRNLNRGQVIGVGASNMIWPGLNAPIIKGKEIVEQRQLPPDPDREARLFKLRDEARGFRFLKLSPLERGWSGNKMPGRSIGPPDPIGEDNFDGFDTKVLEFKTVSTMTSNFGRRRSITVLSVTGNKNGLGGYALGKSIDGKVALRMSKNRAGQKLMFIERCDGHTVFHNFYARYGQTRIFVSKKPKGYGLVCHRALKCICEMVGITDIYAKVEGPCNVRHLTQAFFLGLSKQITHKQIANRMGLHVVEFKKEYGNMPTVVASPPVCRKEADIGKNETTDYELVISQGRVKLFRPKLLPFYTKLPGWQLHLKKTVRFRNHLGVRIRLLAEYGGLKSFLTEQEPQKSTETNKA